MGLFKRKQQQEDYLVILVPVRLEAAALMEGMGSDSPWSATDGTFDLASFFAEMWDVEFMLPTAKLLKSLGITSDSFYEESNLPEQWDQGTKDERLSRFVQSMQWSNMMDEAEYDRSDPRIVASHATLRLKAVGLALACDSTYGTSYLHEIVGDPLSFGVHEMRE